MRLCGLALYSDLSVSLRETKYSERLRELVEYEMAQTTLLNQEQAT